jgi:alpha-L-rhamnosidase
MIGWIEYVAARAREGRHPSRIAARPTPAPHEAFLWDTGYHWGEWLEPGKEMDFTALGQADPADVATAYLHRSSQLLAEIAGVLGRDDTAARYRTLAAATKTAWQTEFIRRDGALTPDTQATHVRALAFDLIPEELRPTIARRLVELIHEAGMHPGTGILATGHLLPVLAEAGHLDVAYDLLLQDTEPSWLTMLARGATTIWESWDALDEYKLPRRSSLNGLAFGAVACFLYRYVAGIRRLDDAPAFRRFAIAPMPGGELTSARAVYDSPYGRIESSWWIEGGQFALDITVPPSTTAEICLPDGQRMEAQPGRASFRCSYGA